MILRPVPGYALALGLALMAGGAMAQAISLPMRGDPAANQISVQVTPGLAHTKNLPTPALREARKAMLAGTDLPDADLRALADQGDGLAALRYSRRLKLDPSASASDIAYYGTVAVSTGRVWPLRDVVAALRRLDPATEPPARTRAYAAMLYPHAWAGNALALDALIDLNGEGRLFGPMSEDTRRKLLEQGDALGDGRVPLLLALPLMHKSQRSAAETDQLRSYLARAAGVQNLAVRTTAENMLALLDGAPTAEAQIQ